MAHSYQSLFSPKVLSRKDLPPLTWPRPASPCPCSSLTIHSKSQPLLVDRTRKSFALTTKWLITSSLPSALLLYLIHMISFLPQSSIYIHFLTRVELQDTYPAPTGLSPKFLIGVTVGKMKSCAWHLSFLSDNPDKHIVVLGSKQESVLVPVYRHVWRCCSCSQYCWCISPALEHWNFLLPFSPPTLGVPALVTESPRDKNTEWAWESLCEGSEDLEAGLHSRAVKVFCSYFPYCIFAK